MSEVSELEQQLEDNKKLMDRRDKAVKLYSNPDFKELIVEGFCVKDCARYCQASQDPALSPLEQQDALNIAQASGHLRRFLSVIMQMGNAAERQIPQIEHAILEARQEGDD